MNFPGIATVVSADPNEWRSLTTICIADVEFGRFLSLDAPGQPSDLFDAGRELTLVPTSALHERARSGDWTFACISCGLQDRSAGVGGYTSWQLPRGGASVGEMLRVPAVDSGHPTRPLPFSAAASCVAGNRQTVLT